MFTKVEVIELIDRIASNEGLLLCVMKSLAKLI